MTREDNVEAGVLLTTAMMTMTAMTTTTGGAAEMRDEVRDGFKALLERDEVEFAPLGDRSIPLVGIAIGRGWGGGDGVPMGGGIDEGCPRCAYNDGPHAWIDAYGS
jgi:hypothetical protein